MDIKTIRHLSFLPSIFLVMLNASAAGLAVEFHFAPHSPTFYTSTTKSTSRVSASLQPVRTTEYTGVVSGKIQKTANGYADVYAWTYIQRIVDRKADPNISMLKNLTLTNKLDSNGRPTSICGFESLINRLKSKKVKTAVDLKQITIAKGLPQYAIESARTNWQRIYAPIIGRTIKKGSSWMSTDNYQLGSKYKLKVAIRSEAIGFINYKGKKCIRIECYYQPNLADLKRQMQIAIKKGVRHPHASKLKLISVNFTAKGEQLIDCHTGMIYKDNMSRVFFLKTSMSGVTGIYQDEWKSQTTCVYRN